MKKVLFFCLIFGIFLFDVKAEELVAGAKSAILIEASTGEVLYEYNADEALSPASMTKMMTLLLTMEAIEDGKINLTDMVHVSEAAAGMGGSQVYLEANSEYKLEEIIKAVCIASGNDAAVVLAETVGGSETNFVSMMNNRAKELGLTATNFVNVYGLDADGHLSSARDMAKIARELVKHKKILEYSSIYEAYLTKQDGSSLWMVNTNKLVRFYSGVDGLKTGFTENAKYCLTATGSWNGMRIISVVMGEESQDSRAKDTTALLNYGKSTFKVNKILEKNKELGTIQIELGKNKEEKIYAENDVYDLIKKSDNVSKYTYKITKEKINAPIKKGQSVGKVEIYKDDKLFKTENIIVNSNIKKCSFLSNMYSIFKVIICGKNY